MSSKTCCKTSVGVIVFSPDRSELLMIERNTLPAGIAPVAGHTWRLFEATVTGQIDASVREVAAVGWWDLAEIQHLAERTADYAAGMLTAKEFSTRPGLEPVWCQHLTELGHVDLPQEDLDAIRSLAATPPSLHL